MKKLRFTVWVLNLLLLIANSALAQTSLKTISLEDLIKKRIFSEAGIDGFKSMNDGVSYSALNENARKIIRYSYKTGDILSTILDLDEAGDSRIKTIVDYEFSADESKLLIQASYNALYRRSFTADYYIYTFNQGNFTLLSSGGPQQLATFSPDGQKVAFVRENNLYIVDLAANAEKQITTDGKFNEIINGAPDWVYEEEFEFNKAFCWSPDSKKLAYMKFDERGVKMFNMNMFQGQKPSLDENALYPSNIQFKYPKAGEDNSIVSVLIYSLESGNTLRAYVGSEKDQYIPRIFFTNDPLHLAVLRLNRLQNRLDILSVNTNTGQPHPLYTEENKCYIDESNFDHIRFLPTGQFVLTSEKSGFTHLYLYNADGTGEKQLTSGEFDVTDFYGYDATRKLFYYQAAATSPLRREIYCADVNGKIKQVSGVSGISSAEFSSNFKYFIQRWSSSAHPAVISLCDAGGKVVRVLEDNQALVDALKGYKQSLRSFFTFNTSEGVNLNGWVIYPPDFDSTRKYPVLLNQYSGPNSQEVLDNWHFGFDEYLAAHGYIVMCVDPRGTGARGEAFRKITYLQLGKYETIDQIETARYAASLPWVDAGRIGIWGWSYGGFISASCMLKGDGIFKAGIAVAPVTNWRYYDNIYTERFMRKPSDNPKGYDQNSPLFFADKLQGSLLLVHGTADDNVHVQNTLELSERLVQAGKQFRQMLYTNRNHGIYGGNTRLHLFTMLENFLNENL